MARIQRRTNTRQNCSRVDAPLKENVEFFVLIWTLGTSHWKEPIQGAPVLHQAKDWTADQPVDGLVWPAKALSDSTAGHVLHNIRFLLKYLD